MCYKRITEKLWPLLIGLLLVTGGCDTGAPYETDDTFATLSARLAYLADPDARYRVMFGETDFDTLSVSRMETKERNYRATSEMTDTLRVWAVGAGNTQTLVLDTLLSLKPQSVINLIQVAPGSPPELIDPELTPSDSTAIAVRFFYADERQAPEADRIKITILAVDYYSLLLAGNNINNVAADKKTEVASFTLAKGELSEPVELDVNLYEDVNRGLPARFFYKITDAATGALIQDYMVSSSATTAEIKIETTKKNNIPHPVYKSGVMQWTWKSAAIPFATPTVLVNGDKW